jgi:hypothetical protein
MTTVPNHLAGISEALSGACATAAAMVLMLSGAQRGHYAVLL